MNTIPTNITEDQLDEYIRLYFKVVQNGYECSILLFKVFNYILYRLHTGWLWDQLRIDPDP